MAEFDWRSDSTVCFDDSLSCDSASLICWAPSRLRLHAFADGLEIWRQRLHVVNDLGQLLAHLLNHFTAPADFLGKLVHPHHAGRHRRLHFLNHLLDIARGQRRLIGQPPDLGRDHGETAPIVAGLFGFNGCVQREKIGLIRHFGDGGDHGPDVAGLLAQALRVAH